MAVLLAIVGGMSVVLFIGVLWTTGHLHRHRS
jgi:hypothetical protein